METALPRNVCGALCTSRSSAAWRSFLTVLGFMSSWLLQWKRPGALRRAMRTRYTQWCANLSKQDENQGNSNVRLRWTKCPLALPNRFDCFPIPDLFNTDHVNNLKQR